MVISKLVVNWIYCGVAIKSMGWKDVSQTAAVHYARNHFSMMDMSLYEISNDECGIIKKLCQ